MASILCKKCGEGIHYHGEPCGIEYRYIKSYDWDRICGSRFDSTKTDKSGYPVLYRTDTLDEDFAESIVKIWRCPNCGSLIVFDEKGKMKKIYNESGSSDMGDVVSEGVAFDDYLWDMITETAASDSSLSSQKPTAYIKIYELGLIASMEKNFVDVKKFVIES